MKKLLILLILSLFSISIIVYAADPLFKDSDKIELTYKKTSSGKVVEIKKPTLKEKEIFDKYNTIMKNSGDGSRWLEIYRLNGKQKKELTKLGKKYKLTLQQVLDIARKVSGWYMENKIFNF